MYSEHRGLRYRQGVRYRADSLVEERQYYCIRIATRAGQAFRILGSVSLLARSRFACGECMPLCGAITERRCQRACARFARPRLQGPACERNPQAN